MIPNSEQWVGQVVNGKFVLGRALGGSEHSAVFFVEKGAGPVAAVIRFVEAASASDRLEHWQAASKFCHPNLLQIFETGRCQIEGKDLFYLLTEYAEENLGQIIPERPLRADEARQVLREVLSALAYIHGQNFVHGGLKPANIFAVGDTIKVSSDSLRPAGQPLAGGSKRSAYEAPDAAAGATTASADIWSLGMTLTQVLTQRLPTLDSQKRAILSPGIPQPFREIIANCLEADPPRRWTAAQISARLGSAERNVSATARSVPASVPAGKPSVKWAYVIPLVVVVVLAILFFPRSKPPAVAPAAQPTREQNSGERTPATPPAATNASGRVVERVKPAISSSAQRTVQGKIRVQVEVKVDERGKVTEARFKSAGPSRYFAERALEATRQWKFQPPVENGQAVASEWRVKFMIGRRTINDSAEQIKP